MSSEVKRFEIGGPDWEMNESPIGEWVSWDDYAALEAENARLAEDVKKWKALAEGVELLGKIDKSSEDRRAQLAAIQGGMGETIEPCTDLNHHERYRAGWNACLAQHQRITAAMAAEVERLNTQLRQVIDQTTPLVPVPGDPNWSRRIELDEVIAERDALRAELESYQQDPSYDIACKTIRELRAELAAQQKNCAHIPISSEFGTWCELCEKKLSN